MLIQAIILALITSFLILLLKKLGIVEDIQIFAPLLITKLVSCDFCFSFWLNVCLYVVMCIFTRSILNPLIIIIATPITRKLL